MAGSTAPAHASATEAARETIDISIIVPLYNEESVVRELCQRLKTVLDGVGRSCEVILVDDASTDATYSIARELAAADGRVKVVKLRANFGQTAGIAAGIDHSSGDILIPMDGDLQHAPEDIPAFLAKLDEGYDIVSGWRKKRIDGLFLRRIPSKIANRLMRYLSGIDLHDFGTTFKAYRRDVIEHVRLYGQFHRFIPVLCRAAMKVKIAEIPIQNIVRPVGQSNYGLGRTRTVLFDLIRLKFLMSFFTRPLQLFGSIGLTLMSLGGGLSVFIGVERLRGQTLQGTLGSSIFLLAISLLLAGLQMILVGLLAELMVKLYYDGNRARSYVVQKLHGEYPRPLRVWPNETVREVEARPPTLK
jgi:glycosyltransferase involved in cell wall biosynthesis